MQSFDSRLISGERAKLKKDRGDSRRFNSGKWLQISRNFVEFRTSSEQMKLPAWSIHEGRGNLEIRFRFGEKHPAISSGTKSHKEAGDRAPDLVRAWIKSRGTEAVKHPLEAACQEFVSEQYADKKPDTRSEVDLILRRLAREFPGISSVGDISPTVFRKGASRLRGKASAKYWANILVTVRKFSRWSVKRGYMAADPTEGIPLPDKGQFGRREEIWPEDIFEQVIDLISPKDREILLVMRWTGMDSGDLAKFNSRHLVKDENGVLTIKKKREKAKVEDETIIQPISSRVRPFFEARLRSGIWWGEEYASIRSFSASLLLRVKTVMLRHGLQGRDLKSLRHTYCTYHAERGVPVDVLRRWVGHARDSRILERYYVHRASTARFMD